jgi:hypothetical protein
LSLVCQKVCQAGMNPLVLDVHHLRCELLLVIDSVHGARFAGAKWTWIGGSDGPEFEEAGHGTVGRI